jgi:HlyD family secretion protein
MPRTQGRTRRSFFIAAVLIVASALAFGWLARMREEEAGSGLVTARVTRGDVTRTVNAVGQLSPLVSVEVSTQITTGLVTDVAVDFNARVRKGQVLARIDPVTFEQRLRQARANLAAGRASHGLVALDAQRMLSLRGQELVTERELDEAQALLRQAEAGLLGLQAEVENARVQLERCTITSPIDGVVIFRQVEVGKTVVSSLSAPTLFTVARDLARMRIVAPVSEVDVGSVAAGQVVTFTVDALPARRFEGRIAQVRNPYTPTDRPQAITQQLAPVTFEAVIEVDNPDLVLRPGLTANVSIVVARRSGVLRLPNAATRVRMRAGQAPRSTAAHEPRTHAAVVYRLSGSGAKRFPEAVEVRLGITDGIVSEVSEGLAEGDEIVISAPDAPRSLPRSLVSREAPWQ